MIKKAIKTKENEAIRRAKRAGQSFGVKAIKTKENEAIRRAKRAGKFLGVFKVKSNKNKAKWKRRLR